ncbi:MAG: tRNA (guanosine(46)-N7)-methyltransferase TrmB [Holosporales bacterium]|jgi:tRNA (guanine-N7-)-methyltransferase|nr:tRNA (guanosine(46)-N7)-methyltransferase TrmB [Holosporales bacterium]
MEKVAIIDERFYGRLKTRSLTVKQKALFDTMFKDVSISSGDDINEKEYKKIFLEIGFGSGEHITQLAVNTPSSLFIGCEPFINGIASLLSKIDESGISNIRIYHGDAKKLIREVPDNFFSGAFLLFPDPWPKRRHLKRRFIQERTILEVHNKLKKEGYWRMATDHEEYKNWILKLFNQEKFKEFFDLDMLGKFSRPDLDFWPKTRYEEKATNEVWYFTCIKK